MEDNDFKFLLAMPTELNAEIERKSSGLHQSKSAFIRQGVRLYVDRLNDRGLNENEQIVPAGAGTLVEFFDRAWDFAVLRFAVQFGVAGLILFASSYFIKL